MFKRNKERPTYTEIDEASLKKLHLFESIDANFNELMIEDKNVSNIIKKCLGIGNKVVKNNRINELIERIDKLHIGYNLNERNNLTKAVGREKKSGAAAPGGTRRYQSVSTAVRVAVYAAGKFSPSVRN